MLKNIPFELIIWLSALILLASADPNQHHFSLCPLENLGFTWCPGCGLGRSISFLFNGDINSSFTQHWFGIPASLILLNRIGILAYNFYCNYTLIKT